jgi:hypothetical protein
MSFKDFHPEESPNTPWPAREGNCVTGKNLILGKVLPNTERRTESGLVIANTKTHQDQPHACRVIKISENVDGDEYPRFKKVKEKYDPNSEGKTFLGPFVLYRQNAGWEWDFPVSSDERWVILEMDDALFVFEPTDKVYNDGDDETRRAIDEDRAKLQDIPEAPPIPNLIIVN